MPTITPGTPLHSFVDAFREATQQAFSQALGASWDVEIDTTDRPPSVETSVLCFQFLASEGLRGNALIQLKGADGLLLAQKLLAESLDPSADLNQVRKDALEQLL